MGNPAAAEADRSARVPTATWTILVLGALTGLGALIRFATLDEQSFWLDELVTVSLLRESFGDMLATIPKSEATPYLYYVIAWPWARVFGLGEVGLRSLSALLGTATVPIAFGAGSALVSRRVGLIAAALVCVSPLLVWYAQEARSYALLAFLTSLTLLFLGQALRGRKVALAGWAVSAALAIATHYFAVFLVAPEAVWLLVRLRPRRPALLASLVPGAMLLAHIPLILSQRGNGGAVAESGLSSRVAGTLKDLVVGYSFPGEIAGSIVAALLVAGGLVLLVTRASDEARRGAVLAGVLAAVSVAVPMALAVAGLDYVIARNAIIAVVPGAVCIAGGYAATRLGLAAAAALCVLSLAITLAVSLDARYGRTDWRGAAQRLGPATDARAIVVTPFMSRTLWRPYLPFLGEPGRRVRVGEIDVVGLATERGFSLGGAVEPPSAEPAAPPPGFHLAAVERTATFVLVRYRAPVPTTVSSEALAGLKLSAAQPGVLVQRPGG